MSGLRGISPRACMRGFTMVAAGLSLANARPARAQGETFTITRGADAAAPTADSLFRAASAAMATGDEPDALRGFRRVISTYPQSSYAPTSMYYAAFLLYRRYHPGQATGPLRAALAVLTTMHKRYPDAPQIADAQTLQTRICGALAARGDRSCEQEVRRAAHPQQLASPSTSHAAGTFTVSGSDGSVNAVAEQSDSSGCRLNIGTVLAAVSGLWKTDTTQAINAMTLFIPNRRPCLENLREGAILTMMGHQVPRLIPVVVDAARNDPDARVRRRALMWLSAQPRDARLSAVLEELQKRDAGPM